MAASEEAAIPLPSDETTPPVMKMYLVIGTKGDDGFGQIFAGVGPTAGGDPEQRAILTKRGIPVTAAPRPRLSSTARNVYHAPGRPPSPWIETRLLPKSKITACRAGSLLLLAALAGCVWVDLKPQGEKVRVLSAAEVRRCQQVGRVTATTTATVGPFTRDADSVRQELDLLARNHAGGMGGDTVVPIGRIVAGEQSYAVYRCIPP